MTSNSPEPTCSILLLAGGGQAINEQLAGGIGFQGSGVADSQHRNVQRRKGYIGLGFH